MSVSSLVCYTAISPCKSKRTAPIDTITIHCMAGNLTVEKCGQLFSTLKRGCSSNYGVGTDGRVALYVPEEYRSWCSSNSANDNRAVTIEVANDGLADTGWHVSDKALQTTVDLVTDICRRNRIPKLVWSKSKVDRVNHKNGCNMTVHRDYAAKACPGDYLCNLHGWIADQVNKRLSGNPYDVDGIDYGVVFDPVFYSAKYADLKAAFGDNADALFNHFLTYGMSEARQANDIFDPVKYRAAEPDLDAAFGDNWEAYYVHYITCGRQEIADGRRAPF